MLRVIAKIDYIAHRRFYEDSGTSIKPAEVPTVPG